MFGAEEQSLKIFHSEKHESEQRTLLQESGLTFRTLENEMHQKIEGRVYDAP